MGPRSPEKLARMEQAVRVLIQGLGEDLEREGLRDTPKRVAKALLDCTHGYHQDTSSTLGDALFHEPIVHHGDEGVVVVRDIDFASTSEETLLPFHGRCHVAYRPKDGVVLGLSKLARLTKQYAKRLQSQERLAAEIVLALQHCLECHGVAVVLHARHLANVAPPEERTCAAVSGVFAAKGSAQLEELLALLHMEDLPASAVHVLRPSLPGFDGRRAGATASSSAAAVSGDAGVAAPGTPDPSERDTDGDSDDLVLEGPCRCEEMESAVQQLLAEAGENPHRPGLAGSARRYVMSLLASTSGYAAAPPPALAAALAGDAGKAAAAAAAGAEGALPVRGCAACSAAAAVAGAGASCGGGSGRACRSSGGGSTVCGGTGDGTQAGGPCAAGSAPGACGRELSGAVTVRLPFASQCEHHMLPFYGRLMVSYIPPVGANGAPIELPRSAVEAVVTMFTQRLQVQERITHQVADAVAAMLSGGGACASSAGEVAAEATGPAPVCVAPSEGGTRCSAAAAGGGASAPALSGAEPDGGLLPQAEEAQAGVMVVCDAAHMCMVARGVENHSGSTTTFAVRGAFGSRPELRRAVLRLFREQC